MGWTREQKDASLAASRDLPEVRRAPSRAGGQGPRPCCADDEQGAEKQWPPYQGAAVALLDAQVGMGCVGGCLSPEQITPAPPCICRHACSSGRRWAGAVHTRMGCAVRRLHANFFY